ncbi:MAG: PAS domain S-box protein [Anaerolineae bacterium]|nr:PAS domain S-box protein [Anaerolineae bacterium]
MRIPLRVLIVEDSEDDALLLVRELRHGGYDPTFERVETAPDMNMALAQQAWDVVLADFKIPGFGGLAALALLQKRGLDLPFIIVSGAIGEETAVEAMKAGAHDYVMKDNLARLLPAVERELREAMVRQERRQARIALETHARQQAALFHLSSELVATLDETDICDKVVVGLHKTLGYDHVGILLVDESTGERVLRACTPAANMSLDLRLPSGQGLSERPLLDGRPHYTPDVTKEPDYVPAFNGLSELDLPLKVGPKVLGVLVIESSRVDAFSEDDFAVLTAAANQVAVALARAREHQAVKAAEIRYQSLFSRMPVGLYRTAPGGQFLEVNPALVEMLGYPNREALLAINAIDLYVDVTERHRWQSLLEQEGVVRDFEVQMYRHDDAIIWARNTARAGRDQEGSQILYYEGSLEDITAHKQAQEALRKSEERYRRLIETSPDAITLTDLQGNLLMTNQQNASMLGYANVEELLASQKDAFDFIAPLDRQRAKQNLEKTLESGSVRNVEYTMLRKDNSTALVELSASLIKNATGAPEAFIGIVRDIAERKRAEEERRRLSAAIEQTAESVIITDTEGVIVYVNPAFERVGGHNRAEVMGQHSRILKSGQHDDAFYREMWAVISGGAVWQGRIVNKRKDGSFYTDEVTITPVRNESGEIVNYVSVQRDVSRELELEEQVRRSQRMEAVGQLTAGIAHDFNNLLTAINGFAELLQYRLPVDSPSYDMAGKILHSGQHAADLVSQLLAFSRKQLIQPKVLSLNEVVMDIVDKMLKRVIGETIELALFLEPALWPVKIDPAQMEQVIVNLAVNARDAMPGGGKLTIETANVVLDDAYVAGHLGAEPGEHVRLCVSDTGCGMSKEVQAHIFEPFFTTKEVNEGTGLGLATVFGIVKQSQGNIWAYSEEGVGSTFKIYLPRATQATDTALRLAETDDLPRGAETILVVEDEAMVRELAVRVLGWQGYTILQAANGREALSLAQKYNGEIHLLLTDMVMPQLGGQLLANQIKTICPDIKILFTSGYTSQAMVTHEMLFAGAEFIQKPFSPRELAHKVREVLDGADWEIGSRK